MSCPVCGAPFDAAYLPGSEVRCPCGVMIQVAPSSSGAARARIAPRPRSCPRCAAALVEMAAGGVIAHACPECGGVFADRAAVSAISLGNLAPECSPFVPSREVDTAALIKCPVCDDPMSRLDFGRLSGVIVDLCIDHGTWFDADEIDRVAAFIASGDHARRAAAPPAADLQLSADARYRMAVLQAKVVQDRHTDMDRAERIIRFMTEGLSSLFD